MNKNSIIDDYHITFDAVSTAITCMRTEYLKIGESDKPILTIPCMFKRSSDENFISDYIAHIFHPRSSGLGLMPIQALLAFAGVSCDCDHMHDAGIDIQREVWLAEESRIDILIIIKRAKVVIAIENKINSAEGENQTLRYAEALLKKYPAHQLALFYLTPSGRKPLSDDFRPLSYRQLYTIISNC